MSRQTDIVTEDELKEILGWEDEGEPFANRHDTHSGYWIRDGERFRFVWSIAEEDR